MSTNLTAQDMGRDLYDDESGNFALVVSRIERREGGDRRASGRSINTDRRQS